jgi:hypothetical protein
MTLKSKMLQLYHKSWKLSLVATIWGGYFLANSAVAKANLSAINLGETHSKNSFLQAQILAPPRLPLPPTTEFPSRVPPPPPTVIFGDELEPFGGNTFDTVGFPNLRYAVYVNGNSPLLLRIIREIEPKSLLRKYQNRKVIQVGSFSDRFFAEDLANFFQFQGIKTQIVRLNSGEEFGRAVDTETSDVFPPVGRNLDYGLGNTDAYYVLISGESRSLADIQQRIVSLGMPRENILFTDVPPKVAVGPFDSEEPAREWQQYLQVSGFPDAELYFGR